MLPQEEAARRAAVERLGERTYAALRDGRPESLVYDDIDLRVLLEPTGATRYAARRQGLAERIGPTEDAANLLRAAEYAGVCVQGARAESAGGVLGLREDGWVFDRVLIIGRQASGQRVAAWIEGTFVYTDRGFGALDLERVEQPRWEHSDLELAPCDLSIRRDLPEAAR